LTPDGFREKIAVACKDDSTQRRCPIEEARIIKGRSVVFLCRQNIETAAAESPGD
jgi:hypothetical protein